MKVEKELRIRRYYNANGYAVAIVACITHPVDWSAYIGATNAEKSEEETAEFVKNYGCKLSEKDARHYFNIDMSYRP